MGRIISLISTSQRRYKKLALKNKLAISEYNEKMISILPLIGLLTILIPLLSVPFSSSKTNVIPAYVTILMIYAILLIAFKLKAMKKYSLIGIYIVFSVIFLFAIYLSVIHTPDMRATILLGVFCIMPLNFIDHPVRITIFAFFWLVVHTILAFWLKPQYALDDTINCLCFCIIGCFLGNNMVRIRLESYEMSRLHIFEKETDILTGLHNRRKLFETIALLETTDLEKPSGILMIDIDHFKNLNDKFGHAAGDKCLTSFGEVLLNYTKNFHLHFFRYGGEEFLALAYGYKKEELYSVAESLRIVVQNANLNGRNITVSIGVSFCNEEEPIRYDKIIDNADMAVYEAKKTGRNKVCIM